MKIDRFVIAIIIVMALAYFFPFWGSKESPLPLSSIGRIGISLIFFFYGLKLSLGQIKDGLKNWKLHVLVQASTFILFPLLVIIFKPLIAIEEGQSLWLPFLFLAALPSTVSSSVVMVSMAKGNIPAAIFNASISGLIGVVITPLWMGLFLPQSTGDFDFSTIYLKLITEILVPVVLGLMLQRFWGKYARKYQKQLTTFDKAVILLIIYKSFAQSFINQIFSAVSIFDLLLILGALMVLFYIVYYLIGYISKALGFTIEDRITAQFCGTKKSLVHGTVFSAILFPPSFPMGLILLPLMIFHAMQIFIISIMALKLSQRKQLKI
ncbi:bile acid:sodium symporter family protein [Algibacter mikhailovii]|uniref:Transporter n=1 Tax=Algibacter mikhailovii TaxID=425498 RepID=A0A918RBM8_9FLAO|nr:bile acid:sodium symporter family protein [Algibacter mikhailovii]GGZ91449.1 transporter [Algibacter mikhailovii]